MRTLLDADSSLASERHQSGSTALHELVGHPDAVRLLLAHGVDPNVRDTDDNATPLHFAASGGPIESVRILLDAGADVHGHGDVHESDVIGWAVGDGSTVHRDIVALLLERGARHHIFSAIGMGDVDLVQSIVEENPDSLSRRRSRFEQRQTPLHFALAAPDGLKAMTPRYKIAELLIELGADIEAEDAKGRTPLAVAMLHDDREAMRLLKAAGAREPEPTNRAGAKEQFEAVRSSITRPVTPMLCVDDVDATVAWYKSLGFALEEFVPPTGKMDWASMSFGKTWIMVQSRSGRPMPQIALWFWTNRIEELYDLLKQRQLEAAKAAMAGDPSVKSGIRFHEDLYEPHYGGRQFSIADVNGFELVFQSMFQ
jgi:ankyrin repeat protein